MNAADLANGLAHHIGTTSYTKHGLMRDLLMTEGVVFLAENAGAHWLTDIVASHLLTNKKLRDEEFQVWTLEKNGEDQAQPNRPHRVFVTDGNSDQPIVTQELGYTDFPLAEIKLYCSKAAEFGPKAWVLMLTSEY